MGVKLGVSHRGRNVVCRVLCVGVKLGLSHRGMNSLERVVYGCETWCLTSREERSL